jgi:hypothetical protein
MGNPQVLFFLQSVQHQSINLLLAGKCTIIWLINQFQLLLLLFYFFHVLLDHTSRQLATTWSYILVAVKWSWETLLFVWLKGKKEEGKKIPHPNEWIWTNVSPNSFIGMRNFLSFLFLSIQPNEALMLYVMANKL